MFPWTKATVDAGRRWLQFLHLFYAALFALVLPFICWGAQATPGHPHAMAHFVFAAPPLKAAAAAEGMDAAAWLEAYAQAEICTSHPVSDIQNRVAEPAQVPPARSIPSLLSTSFLTVISLFALTWPIQSDGPQSLHLVASPESLAHALLIPTPPPR
jgi:hypothetical protein